MMENHSVDSKAEMTGENSVARKADTKDGVLAASWEISLVVSLVAQLV